MNLFIMGVNCSLTTILTYVFLFFSVISLWTPLFKKAPLWVIMLVISTFFGLLSQRLEPVALVFIFLLVLSMYSLGKPSFLKIPPLLATIVALIICVGLGMHLLPGFHNLKILDNVYMSKDAVPFTLYFNFDKTLVGLLIIGFLHQTIVKKSEWIKMLRTMLPLTVMTIMIVAGFSFLFQYIRFEPKLPNCFAIWACTNLLFVCVAEEGFFRGFIQKYLCQFLQQFRYGNGVAIVLSSILFGLYHYLGGVQYVVLATIAGLGYGLVYFKTNRIEASILTHFLLNVVHFLLFTYPALAPIQ